jgi:toxin secretion/phage lysis holin
MDKLTSVKTGALTVIGIIGGFITGLLGGWDTALQTLVMFMGIDYVMGLVLAGVFHKSNKTATGTLESMAGWKGICKKGITLLIVLVAAQLDLLMDIDYVRYAAIIAFIVNELLSIIENAGLMGIPIPTIIVNAIDILKKQKDKEVKE